MRTQQAQAPASSFLNTAGARCLSALMKTHVLPTRWAGQRGEGLPSWVCVQNLTPNSKAVLCPEELPACWEHAWTQPQDV